MYTSVLRVGDALQPSFEGDVDLAAIKAIPSKAEAELSELKQTVRDLGHPTSVPAKAAHKHLEKGLEQYRKAAELSVAGLTIGDEMEGETGFALRNGLRRQEIINERCTGRFFSGMEAMGKAYEYFSKQKGFVW